MRILTIVAVVAIALVSMGAVTWDGYRSSDSTSIAVFTTGTESAPPDSSVAQGLDLSTIIGFTVHVEAAGALSASTADAYLYNTTSSQWNPAPALNFIIAGGANSEASAGYTVTRPPKGTRIAFIPNGLGIGSTIKIVGTFKL